MRKFKKMGIFACAAILVSMLVAGCNRTIQGNTDDGGSDSATDVPKDHPAH